jgi:tRNA(Ile)-lysidine synthase
LLRLFLFQLFFLLVTLTRLQQPPLAQRIAGSIRQEGLIDPDDHVLVGVSGGVDSSVLLFLLLKIQDAFPFRVGVAHLNHCLRGEESTRDEEFVRGLAERFGLPFHVRRIDVKSYAHTEGRSLQHAGRDLRYAYFRELACEHGYQRIAIGHTRDDQVETFIMRIIKGTGLRGLSSIPMRRGPIIRPLLPIYRSEIETYAKTELVPYVEDSSNQRDVYQRNFIRNRVLPLFEQINPNFRERVLLLLDDLTILNGLFERDAERFLSEEVRSKGADQVVQTERLKSLHPETRFRVLAGMLERVEPRFVPLRSHVRLIEQAIQNVKPNIDIALPGHVTGRKVYGSITFTKEASLPPIPGLLPIQPGLNLLETFGILLEVAVTDVPPENIPDDGRTAFFDCDRTGTLQVRTFLNGDRFVPLGMKESVKLKNFFISRRIPLHERRRIPLLLSDQDIIWVMGQRIDDRYKVTPATRRFLRVVVKPNQ